MNSKNQKTLKGIFEAPIKKSIKWSDVERLIHAPRGTINQGSGFRVRIIIGEVSLNIHTPHPQEELKPYQVPKLRELLIEGDITP